MKGALMKTIFFLVSSVEKQSSKLYSKGVDGCVRPYV
jgi:hypothetical protein